MPDQKPLGAQISHMLKDRGVDVIFGIPGVHNQEMYRGIEDAGITHILARHEQGAGFMADGYARASGKPGVCYVITGPGLCNVMTPLGQAYSDSVPVLCIASCLDETAARQGQLHQMRDQEAAAATVCDWSHTARTADAAYQLVERALGEFGSMRPRPKAIHVPIELLETPVAAAPKAHGGMQPAYTPNAHVPDVAAALENAKKPLFIFGGGVAARGPDFRARQAQLAVEGFGAASFTTYAARGLMGADHPQDFGSYLARSDSADVIAQADVVIAIGTTLSECDLWRDQLGHTGRLIRVDIDSQVAHDGHIADLVVIGDANEVLRDLATVYKPDTATLKWDPEDIAKTKSRWRAQVDAERPGIVAVCDIIRDTVPNDTMFYSDMTQFAYAATEVTPMHHPAHWHHPTGFGTLGYALPAAIGGAVARPDLPTMAIIGDYGFQYTVQELGTAVELGQPLPIILWDNGKLGEIEDSMVRAQIAPNAVIAHNPDFLMLAKAYGAAATNPKTEAELRSALTTAFQTKGPTVILLTSDFKP